MTFASPRLFGQVSFALQVWTLQAIVRGLADASQVLAAVLAAVRSPFCRRS